MEVQQGVGGLPAAVWLFPPGCTTLFTFKEWTENQHTRSASETIGIAGNFFSAIVVKCSFVEVIISKSLGKTVQLQCTVPLGKLSDALTGSALTRDATQESQKLSGRKSIKGVSCNGEGKSWIFLLLELVRPSLSAVPSSITKK